MGCNNSKIIKHHKIQTELDIKSELKEVPISNEIKEIKELPISNEVKKYNIKINVTRPNPMVVYEENKNLRIKIPK
jgi:hypothetical protein